MKLKNKYIITGQINPLNVNFSFAIQDELIKLVLDFPEFSVKELLNITFKNSKIYAEIETEKDYSSFKLCNLATLKNLIYIRVCTIIDRYCYVKSCNYEVEITNIQCPELDIDYIPDVRGEMNIVKGQEETSKEMTKLINLLCAHPELNFLNDVFIDFRLGIKYTYMTGSFCYRAIEIIRLSYFENEEIVDDKKRRIDGWEKLRNTLGLERNYFDDIKKSALPTRHGAFSSMKYTEREKIMNKTRFIIDRFVHLVTNEKI